MSPNLEHYKALAGILEEVLVKGYRKEVEETSVSDIIHRARVNLKSIMIREGDSQTEWIVSNSLRMIGKAESMNEAGELSQAICSIERTIFRFIRDFDKLGNLK